MDQLKILSRFSQPLNWIIVVMIPFVSWGSVPWLTGLLGLLVALSLLFKIRRDEESDGGVVICCTALWIPLALVMGLALVHLVSSPVPYSSLLFIVHITIAGTLYFLLLDNEGIHGPIPVFAWSAILVTWMSVEKFLSGSQSPSGPFQNPNYLATVLLTCLAWCLGNLVVLKTVGQEGSCTENSQRNDHALERIARHPATLLVTALVLTGTLAFIGSRSAGLAILGLWGVLAVSGKGLPRLFAAALIVLILFAPTTLKHRVTEGYRQDPHAFSRLQIWEGAFRMGLDHPVLGVGPNLYYENSFKYSFPTETLPVRYGRIARKPHNEYLRAWAEGGLWGAGAVLLFLLATARLFFSAWRHGSYGHALAVAVLLFQALFHDVNEVFALTALGAFWLAGLSRHNIQNFTVSDPRRRWVITLAGFTVLLMALWLSLDVSARIQWRKGQQAMGKDNGVAALLFERAHGLNPLLPGAARDLAGAWLSRYRATGTPEDLEIVETAIHRARRLNRLDGVPLRMEATLLVEQASRLPGNTPALLHAALGHLEESLVLEPSNAIVMLRISEIHWDLGDSEKALALVERALETEPNYMEAHQIRITYLEEMDQEAVPAAELELVRALGKVEEYQPQSTYERLIVRQRPF